MLPVGALASAFCMVCNSVRRLLAISDTEIWSSPSLSSDERIALASSLVPPFDVANESSSLLEIEPSPSLSTAETRLEAMSSIDGGGGGGAPPPIADTPDVSEAPLLVLSVPLPPDACCIVIKSAIMSEARLPLPPLPRACRSPPSSSSGGGGGMKASAALVLDELLVLLDCRSCISDQTLDRSLEPTLETMFSPERKPRADGAAVTAARRETPRSGVVCSTAEGGGNGRRNGGGRQGRRSVGGSRHRCRVARRVPHGVDDDRVGRDLVKTR
ncbi:hypothetical protein A33M_2587 [Rhodovulum sp. PH10]|nr:hypothetical protein A33M_2587 [Rhodovulum sp. PH10]